jgi:hypothetical protein
MLDICSKLLEKEKQKLFQLSMSQKLHQREMGALLSLPNINENSVLELQGAI